MNTISPGSHHKRSGFSHSRCPSPFDVPGSALRYVIIYKSQPPFVRQEGRECHRRYDPKGTGPFRGTGVKHGKSSETKYSVITSDALINEKMTLQEQCLQVFNVEEREKTENRLWFLF